MSVHNEKMREIVLLLLFGMTHHNENESRDLQTLVMEELRVSRSAVREAASVVASLIESLPVVDALISEVAISFSFDRIQATELAILRLAFWELFVDKKLHPKIVLGETNRLLKKFASPDAVSFVHALIMNACEKQKVSFS